MNVEIGAEAAQFPGKEYINGIAFAVYLLLINLHTVPIYEINIKKEWQIFKQIKRWMGNG